MANNIPAFKTELLNLLQNTVNLDATAKQDARNYVVAGYPAEWNARLQSGTPDTPTNRAIFAVDKWMGWLSEIVKAGRTSAAVASVPVQIGIE